MTPNTLLSELQTRGVILEPRGDKLAFGPKEKVTPELRGKIVEYKAELLRLLQSDLSLADAYRRYWTTPEKAPLTSFLAILDEIALLEGQLDPAAVISILEQSAQSFHRETGICPFCGKAGPLHHGTEGHEG